MLHCQPDRRGLIQSAALLLAASVAAVPAWSKDAEAPLPDIRLLDGRVWSPAAMQGKALVVYWWASWCPFCAVQSPHIEALWRARKSQGLEVLALSIDRLPAHANAYIKAKGYSFPTGMLTPQVAKMLPKPRGLPVVVVVQVNGQDGRSGKVVFAEGGEMFPEDIEGLKKYI